MISSERAKTLRQVLRFGLVGGLATAIHVVSFGLYLQLQGMSPAMANLAAFVTAFTISFVGHCYWTFYEYKGMILAAMARFSIVALAGFALNSAIVAVVIEYAGAPASVAMVLMATVTPAFTFVMSRLWVFRARAV